MLSKQLLLTTLGLATLGFSAAALASSPPVAPAPAVTFDTKSGTPKIHAPLGKMKRVVVDGYACHPNDVRELEFPMKYKQPFDDYFASCMNGSDGKPICKTILRFDAGHTIPDTIEYYTKPTKDGACEKVKANLSGIARDAGYQAKVLVTDEMRQYFDVDAKDSADGKKRAAAMEEARKKGEPVPPHSDPGVGLWPAKSHFSSGGASRDLDNYGQLTIDLKYGDYDSPAPEKPPASDNFRFYGKDVEIIYTPAP